MRHDVADVSRADTDYFRARFHYALLSALPLIASPLMPRYAIFAAILYALLRALMMPIIAFRALARFTCAICYARAFAYDDTLCFIDYALYFRVRVSCCRAMMRDAMLLIIDALRHADAMLHALSYAMR